MRKAEKQASLNRLCALLELPMSCFYYKSEQSVKPKNEPIKQAIMNIHHENNHCYGKRRMSKALAQAGIIIGVYKTARLMKDLFILAKRPRKKHYYVASKEKPDIKNHLNREFKQDEINTHWVSDITYIRNNNGWSYLATVLDLGSREIVGFSTSQKPDAELVKKALTNAISAHKPNTHGLMFHSDQGSQYSSYLIQETLALHGIKQSMSRRGNCWDNAVQERFFRNLKSEYLNELSFSNHKEVVAASKDYIQYYNYKRLNSALGYITPFQKRQELLTKKA